MLHPEPTTLIPQLAVWPISGNSTEARSFQRKQPPSCSNPGGPRLISLTTHSSGNGIAGVVNGVQIQLVANFLAFLHKEGYQYNSINSYRSAISSVHEKVDGVSVGQHPTVTRLLKGVFHDRPPLPRYSSTWNVQLVLDFLGALGKNEDLTHVWLQAIMNCMRKVKLSISTVPPTPPKAMSLNGIQPEHYRASMEC